MKNKAGFGQKAARFMGAALSRKQSHASFMGRIPDVREPPGFRRIRAERRRQIIKDNIFLSQGEVMHHRFVANGNVGYAAHSASLVDDDVLDIILTIRIRNGVDLAFLHIRFGMRGEASGYLMALGVFAYTAGFIGNFWVPKSMDSPAEGSWQSALLTDLGLLLLFGLQHSVMARPAFKRVLAGLIPPAAERSTYVMASNLALLLLFWKWKPLGGTVWEVTNNLGISALYAAYAFRWALLLFATFVINHFDLFGLRQIWLNLQGRSYSALKFRTPWLYRMVRHPLYIGWITLFWCTPVMTATHLFFAVTSTVYIFVAIQFEERDLVASHPEYADYRRQVPMIVPGLPKQVVLTEPAPPSNQPVYESVTGIDRA